MAGEKRVRKLHIDSRMLQPRSDSCPWPIGHMGAWIVSEQHMPLIQGMYSILRECADFSCICFCENVGSINVTAFK